MATSRWWLIAVTYQHILTSEVRQHSCITTTRYYLSNLKSRYIHKSQHMKKISKVQSKSFDVKKVEPKKHFLEKVANIKSHATMSRAKDCVTFSPRHIFCLQGNSPKISYVSKLIHHFSNKKNVKE